jgi:apolipoprotein N-acyltransferase
LSQEYPGLLFCFEGISPTGVRQILEEREDTPFIAHPISHAWFHEPEEVWHQLDAALKVQAVWNDMTIASAGRHAKSKVYFPDGSIVVPEPVASGHYWEVSLVEIAVK